MESLVGHIDLSLQLAHRQHIEAIASPSPMGFTTIHFEIPIEMFQKHIYHPEQATKALPLAPV